MKLLVVVPSFPSLNQPWIDTYLESLLREGIQFRILSGHARPQSYHKKVDRLNLRDRVLLYSTKPREWIPSFLRFLITNPAHSSRDLAFAWTDTRILGGRLRSRIRRTMWSAYISGLIDRAGTFDLAHVHFEDTSLAFSTVFRGLGIALVTTFHGQPPKGIPQLNPEEQRILYSRVHGVFVNTERARSFLKQSGCPTKIMRLVPQGLPLEDFPFLPPSTLHKNDPVRILSVGRFHRDKGHAYSILSARRLKKANVNFKWIFVGTGPTNEVDRLKRLMIRLGLEDFVEFVYGAELETLVQLYRESHLLVLASIDQGKDRLTETQGVVVQEAQASGCIPIVTRVGGVPECVRDGIDAIVVRPGSSRAISDAVLGLLDRAVDWPQMMAAGRKNVESRFSAVAIGKEMARHLRAFAEGGTHSGQ